MLNMVANIGDRLLLIKYFQSLHQHPAPRSSTQSSVLVYWSQVTLSSEVTASSSLTECITLTSSTVLMSCHTSEQPYSPCVRHHPSSSCRVSVQFLVSATWRHCCRSNGRVGSRRRLVCFRSWSSALDIDWTINPAAPLHVRLSCWPRAGRCACCRTASLWLHALSASHSAVITPAVSEKLLNIHKWIKAPSYMNAPRLRRSYWSPIIRMYWFLL